MADESERTAKARKALKEACGYFSEGERYGQRFYSAMKSSVEALFALHEAKEHDILVELLAENTHEFVGTDYLQEHILFRLPPAVLISAVRRAKDFKTRVAIATLIPEAERVRELIKEAWERKDLDEAAAIYAAAYGDGDREDRLAGSRETSLDGHSIDMLRALHDYPWPSLPQTQGIRNPWLKEELEAHESQTS